MAGAAALVVGARVAALTTRLEVRAAALLPIVPVVAQVRAAIRLIERQQATVVAVAAIHLDVNDQTREVLTRYPCVSVQNERSDDGGR